MREFAQPRVVVSKCLGFDACRYNGEMHTDPTVKRLATHVKFIPVCPEMEIGLGTPREVVRVVNDGRKRLVQPSTGRDLTDLMIQFSDHFLNGLNEVDGFILKNRSPSCGLRDVKIYSSDQKAGNRKKGSGFFAAKVMEKYPCLAVEEEGRLKNFTIREHFFTKLFTLARFRTIKKAPSMKELVKFHSENKYLFMAYNQTQLKNLGRIAANHDHKQVQDVYTDYEAYLYKLFNRAARYTSNINVCQHIMGYFSKYLSSKEKEFFLDMLDKYKNKKVPLSSLIGILKSWALRFNNEYLLNQTYFEPYPEDLVEISDSGKGRDYK